VIAPRVFNRAIDIDGTRNGSRSGESRRSVLVLSRSSRSARSSPSTSAASACRRCTEDHTGYIGRAVQRQTSWSYTSILRAHERSRSPPIQYESTVPDCTRCSADIKYASRFIAPLLAASPCESRGGRRTTSTRPIPEERRRLLTRTTFFASRYHRSYLIRTPRSPLMPAGSMDTLEEPPCPCRRCEGGL
jgi:hypothetical protein